jgi:hypothetical protein
MTHDDDSLGGLADRDGLKGRKDTLERSSLGPMRAILLRREAS